MLKKILSSLSLIPETAKKERQLIFKDGATVEIYILFIALVYFFYTFVYSPEIFTKLPIAFVDNDQTTMSHQIRRMLNETESLDITYDASSLEEAKTLFEEEKVSGIIVIPEKFSEKVQKNGSNPSIAIYCDASYMLYYDKTLQAVTNTLSAFTGELQLKQTMMSGVPMKEAIASSKPFNIIATPLYNLDEGYAIFIIPVVLIVAMQTLQLTGMGVLYGTLREKNTFIQHFSMARRSRFGYFFMTIGRSLPYLLISSLLLLMGIEIVFHIFTIPQRGNTFEVMMFTIPVILSITFLGMFLMNIFRNREDTIMLLTVFSIPALMMGGVSYPIVAFPLWIKVMAFFFPSTVGVKGFLALTQAGASLYEIKEIFMQMWGICIFYFILAVWTNRKFLYKPSPLALSVGGSPPIVIDNIESTEVPVEANNIVIKKEMNPKETIRTLLTPFRDMVWDYDKVLSQLEESLAIKLSAVPEEKYQKPAAYIAIPTLEASRYAADSEDLKNLYVNIMGNAMHADNAAAVHPSYIDIVKSLTPDEARLLRLFITNDAIPFINVIKRFNKESSAYSVVLEHHLQLSQKDNIEIEVIANLPLYFNNFVRMGLLSSPEGYSLERDKYTDLENSILIKELKTSIEKTGSLFETQRRFYKITPFGRAFVTTVIQNS